MRCAPAPGARVTPCPKVRVASPSVEALTRVRAVPLVVIQVVTDAERGEGDPEDVERLVERGAPPGVLGHADGGHDLGQVQPDVHTHVTLAVGARGIRSVRL